MAGGAHGQGTIEWGRGEAGFCPPLRGAALDRELGARAPVPPAGGVGAGPPSPTRASPRGAAPCPGDVYAGEWRRGAPHGVGAQRYANGDTFEGVFREGRRHGHGIYRWADGSQKYIGSPLAPPAPQPPPTGRGQAAGQPAP
jgi:hypothetical protein